MNVKSLIKSLLRPRDTRVKVWVRLLVVAQSGTTRLLNHTVLAKCLQLRSHLVLVSRDALNLTGETCSAWNGFHLKIQAQLSFVDVASKVQFARSLPIFGRGRMVILGEELVGGHIRVCSLLQDLNMRDSILAVAHRESGCKQCVLTFDTASSKSSCVTCCLRSLSAYIPASVTILQEENFPVSQSA